MDIFDMAFSSGLSSCVKQRTFFVIYGGGDAVASHFGSAFRQVRAAR
jgi:hypothetical protein